MITTQDSNIFYEDEDGAEVPSVLQEMMVLPLSSNITSSKIRKSIESLMLTEREL